MSHCYETEEKCAHKQWNFQIVDTTIRKTMYASVLGERLFGMIEQI